ncbi:MAG TPA: polysaccharide deacetylase family protein [Solirubrobacteraceae bacterium]|jgi:peptidoglycan/xylan/chitin deacetylase (PgdA/CDA1 family)|nr:polysaccharide deacetylase family protein [Solirubrobacteraceae bacterium]
MGWSKGQVLARGLEWTGIGPGLRRMGSWRGALVLNYHRIGDSADSNLDRALWSATADQLDRQLAFVARNFDVIGPAELAAAAAAPRGRRVLVTFDDGYRDVYTVAFRLLEANGIRATLFLCTGFIDGRASPWWDEIAWMLRSSADAALAPGPWAADHLPLSGPCLETSIARVNQSYRTLEPEPAARFLEALATATGAGRRPRDPTDWITWEMAREMRAAGHEIGAHTVTHPLLARLPVERQREEIVGALDRIEAELGERSRWFSYPVGLRDTFTDETSTCLREAGVEHAFSNYGGYVHHAGLCPLDVPRSNVGPALTGPSFHAVLTLPQFCARV